MVEAQGQTTKIRLGWVTFNPRKIWTKPVLNIEQAIEIAKQMIAENPNLVYWLEWKNGVEWEEYKQGSKTFKDMVEGNEDE